MIIEFLLLEDPRKEFRHAKKAYEELKQSIAELTTELRKTVVALYNGIFDELESEAKKLNVSITVYDNRDLVISSIESIKSIAQLKNKKLGADDYKRAQLEKIIAAIPIPPGGGGPKPATYHITQGASTISNHAEMEIFIQKVREDMQKLLNDNKTIILK